MGGRAFEFARKRRRHLYYFDIGKYEAGRERGDAPFTPAIQTIQLVHRSLSMFKDIGFKSVMERHRRASTAFLSAAKHLSLTSFSAAPSSSVQVLVTPPGCEVVDLPAKLAQAGFIVAGGQGELTGKVIRTGFLGAFGSDILLRFVIELGRILEREGCRVDMAAAENAVRTGVYESYPF
jgi:aspartate aminotransferase-like enzyme